MRTELLEGSRDLNELLGREELQPRIVGRDVADCGGVNTHNQHANSHSARMPGVVPVRGDSLEDALGGTKRMLLKMPGVEDSFSTWVRLWVPLSPDSGLTLLLERPITAPIPASGDGGRGEGGRQTALVWCATLP